MRSASRIKISLSVPWVIWPESSTSSINALDCSVVSAGMIESSEVAAAEDGAVLSQEVNGPVICNEDKALPKPAEEGLQDP